MRGEGGEGELKIERGRKRGGEREIGRERGWEKGRDRIDRERHRQTDRDGCKSVFYFGPQLDLDLSKHRAGGERRVTENGTLEVPPGLSPMSCPDTIVTVSV